jgi:hypothetical protein
MRSFYQLAFLALPLCSTALAGSPTKMDDLPKTIYASAQEAFQDLLNALPEESLHAALSGLEGFKSGVFESHSRGVEHVHENNPALATKLIVDAVNDLRKRQAPGNGTTTVTEANTPAPQTSQEASQPPAEPTTITEEGTTIIQTVPAETSNQQPAETRPAETTTATAPAVTQTVVDGTTVPVTVVDGTTVAVTVQDGTTVTAAVPTTVTTTAQRPAIIPVQETVTQDGSTVVRTTQVLSEVTASVAVTIVRTNAGGNTVTATENRPAVIKTITNSAGQTTVTTSAAELAPTAGEVKTSTDEAGSTFLTTYTPGGGLVSSIKLITTTDAEGRPSTMTSYTFVDPIQATQTAGNNDGDRTGNPSVQTAAAGKNALPYAVGLGALALFV